MLRRRGIATARTGMPPLTGVIRGKVGEEVKRAPGRDVGGNTQECGNSLRAATTCSTLHVSPQSLEPFRSFLILMDCPLVVSPHYASE